MATIKLIQDTRRDLASQLASLQQLEREIELARKGAPSRPKLRKPPMFVGMSASDADRALKQELSVSAKTLKNAYAGQGGMSVYNDYVSTITAAFGNSAELAKYSEFAAKVGLHLLVEGAQRSLVTQKAQIHAAMETYIEKVTAADGSIGEALQWLDSETSVPTKALNAAKAATGSTAPDSANPYHNKVYSSMLLPINIEYVRYMDNSVEKLTEEKGSMLHFIDNAASQRAVIMALPTSTPAENVLLPNQIANSGGTAELAFKQNRGKDIAATYRFYKKATDQYISGMRGVQTGDVKALLRSAKETLRKLPKIISEAGFSNAVAAPFNKGAKRIAGSLKEDRDSIILATIELADMIGALGEPAGATWGAGNYDLLSPFNPADNGSLDEAVSQEVGAGGGAHVSPLFEDLDFDQLHLQESLKPDNVDVLEIRDPRTANLKNAMSRVILDLRQAYSEMSGGLFGPTSYPEGVPTRQAKVTATFKEYVDKAVAELLKTIATQVTFTGKAEDIYRKVISDGLNDLIGFQPGIAYDQYLIADETTIASSLSQTQYLQLANGSQLTLDSILGGQSIRQNIEESLDSRIKGSRGQIKRGDANKLRSAVQQVMNYANNYMKGLSVQARSAGIRLRQNPGDIGTMGQVGVGLGSWGATHGTTSGLQGVVAPTSGTVPAYAVDLLPSVAGAGIGAYMAFRESDQRKDIGIPLMVGSVTTLISRQLMRIPALRFSENAFIKALQWPTNVLAYYLGDMSLGPCSAMPLHFKTDMDKAKVAAEINKVVRQNPPEIAAILGAQAAINGLSMTAANLTVNEPPTLSELSAEQKATILNEVTMVAEYFWEVSWLIHNVEAEKDLLAVDETLTIPMGSELETEVAISYNEANAAYVASQGEALKLLPAVAALMGNGGEEGAESDMGGFILEPGYNAKLYSGEDGYAPLVPAPRQTGQPGYDQLENAINRAQKLTPHEISAEGYHDLAYEGIIRATPSIARQIEGAGRGVSIGASRTNPATELVNLEVQWTNGLEDIAPARQQSVPQGELGYPRIEHAQEINVSPRGAFNRGAFSPVFG